MDTLRRWIPYDTFKIIVALILLIGFIILLLQPPTAAQTASPTQAVAAAQVQQAPTDTPVPPTAAPTATLAPSPTATVPPPTATPLPSPTPTQVPPTATPTVTPTTAAQPQTAAVDCPKALPTHLSVGKQAVVMSNLNLRKAAGMDQAILNVSPPNVKLDVIGGPTCIPYQSGAYLWWNVKTADGTAGWSAEGSLSGNFYFLRPIP